MRSRSFPSDVVQLPPQKLRSAHGIKTHAPLAPGRAATIVQPPPSSSPKVASRSEAARLGKDTRGTFATRVPRYPVSSQDESVVPYLHSRLTHGLERTPISTATRALPMHAYSSWSAEACLRCTHTFPRRHASPRRRDTYAFQVEGVRQSAPPSTVREFFARFFAVASRHDFEFGTGIGRLRARGVATREFSVDSAISRMVMMAGTPAPV